MGRDENGHKIRCKREFKTKIELLKHLRKGDHKAFVVSKQKA